MSELVLYTSDAGTYRPIALRGILKQLGVSA